MSTMTLVTPTVHWSDEARASVVPQKAWFEEFDHAVTDLEDSQPLSVRQDADTWYFVNDTDVSFPVDPAENLGLDTWDF